MGKAYVKNKDLGIKRAPSSFLLFNKKVMGKGCEAKPRRRLRDKTYVKERRVERWRMMPEAERQQFCEEMLEGHKETKEKRTMLLHAREDENIAVAEEEEVHSTCVREPDHKDAASAAQPPCPQDPRLAPGSFLGKDWQIVRSLGS